MPEHSYAIDEVRVIDDAPLLQALLRERLG
jgi:hypothetical protein